jgi:hypothetical protein
MPGDQLHEQVQKSIDDIKSLYNGMMAHREAHRGLISDYTCDLQHIEEWLAARMTRRPFQAPK